jgi:hypothetical protein
MVEKGIRFDWDWIDAYLRHGPRELWTAYAEALC